MWCELRIALTNSCHLSVQPPLSISRVTSKASWTSGLAVTLCMCPSSHPGDVSPTCPYLSLLRSQPCPGTPPTEGGSGFSLAHSPVKCAPLTAFPGSIIIYSSLQLEWTPLGRPILTLEPSHVVCHSSFTHAEEINTLTST